MLTELLVIFQMNGLLSHMPFLFYLQELGVFNLARGFSPYLKSVPLFTLESSGRKVVHISFNLGIPHMLCR